MKHIITIVAFLFITFSWSQEKQKVDLLTAANWGQEIIHFPLHFAKEIKYEGVEDIRFAKGWSTIDSPEFWTYAFVWDINITKAPTEQQLEKDMQYYFDGLMKIVNKDASFVVPKTSALFLKQESNLSVTKFIGKINVYDAFNTKKMINLYVSVAHYYCKQKKRSMLLFRFSPKEFKHSVWTKLNNIQLRSKVCDFTL